MRPRLLSSRIDSTRQITQQTEEKETVARKRVSPDWPKLHAYDIEHDLLINKMWQIFRVYPSVPFIWWVREWVSYLPRTHTHTHAQSHDLYLPVYLWPNDINVPVASAQCLFNAIDNKILQNTERYRRWQSTVAIYHSFNLSDRREKKRRMIGTANSEHTKRKTIAKYQWKKSVKREKKNVRLSHLLTVCIAIFFVLSSLLACLFELAF